MNKVTLTSAPIGFRRYRVDEFTFERGVEVDDVPEKVVKQLKELDGYQFDVSKTQSSGSSGGGNQS